jgi:23S rRNA (cytosine1962-C5)-methyltransferase
MLVACRDLMADDPLFAILTVYAMRASFVSFHELFAETFAARGGLLQSGELLIEEEELAGKVRRRLATSLFCRWQARVSA